MTIVNKAQLADYIRTYIDTLLNTIINLDDKKRDYFDFHKEYPFHCIGYISATHGAAVIFRPSDKLIIEIRNVKERIESIFPINPIFGDTLIQTEVVPDKIYRIYKSSASILLRKCSFYQKKDELLIISKGLSFTIEEDCVYLIQDRLILKGNNRFEEWSKSVAKVDAFNEIQRILINFEGLLPSDQIKELQNRITNFKKLIDEPDTKEEVFQDFFERYKEFLSMGCTYKKIYPHLRLPFGESYLIPDFLLERVKDGYCDIMDIKLPDKALIVGGINREKFSFHVESAIAQVHEYKEYFNDPNNLKNIEDQYNIKIYKPRIYVLIGLDSYPKERIKINSRYAEQIEIITYDHILNYVNQLLSEVKKYKTSPEEKQL